MKASRDRTEQFTYTGGSNARNAPPSGEPARLALSLLGRPSP